MRSLKEWMIVVALIAANLWAASLCYSLVWEPHKEEIRCIGRDFREAPLRTSWRLASIAAYEAGRLIGLG